MGTSDQRALWNGQRQRASKRQTQRGMKELEVETDEEISGR